MAVHNVVGITFNWRSGKQEDIIAMIDYLSAHAQELGINTDEICVFSLCRSVNYTIECVLRYPEIKKMILYYGKVSKKTKLANCANPYKYSVELCVHPQGVHGFDYANDDEYTKGIIEKTIEFIKN